MVESEKQNSPGQARAENRRNLAYDLADREERKKYLHSNRHTLPAILRRMYRPVFKNSRILAASAVYAVTSGILPILSVFIVFYLTRLIDAPSASLPSIFLYSGIYGAVFLLFSIIAVQVENRNYSWFMELRLKIMNAALDQYMTMDLGIYENPSFLDDIANWDRSLASNNVGLEGTYHTVFKLGGTLVSTLALGTILAFVDVRIFLTGFGFVLVYWFTRSSISGYQHARREELSQVQRRAAHLSSEASDFRYGKDIRLFFMAPRFIAAFQPLLKSYESLYRAFTLREFQLSFLESAALAAIDAVSFFILIGRLLNGSLSLPFFVMLLSAVTLFSQTLQLLGQQLAFVKAETRYVGDTFDFIDADLQSRGGSEKVPGDDPVTVTFENVSFHYPGSDHLVLENLDLTLKAGESYALVGINGAGKTTLVKLLTGLYLPTAGRILINGIDSATLSQKELFSLFGVVFQEVQPLALTVAENVAGTDTEVDRDRVEESLKAAGLWEKIKSLPEGIDAPMLKVIEDSGIVLSGGENQKLAIARALYRRNTRMMVMDEPTAALDALAEEKIYQEFDELLKGRTSLFISHRLASTRFCSEIILLNGGRITQKGTHDELMAKDGLYRQMFETQGKYYQSAEASPGIEVA